MKAAFEEKELEPYIFLLVANSKLSNLTAEQIYSIAMLMKMEVIKAVQNQVNHSLTLDSVE